MGKLSHRYIVYSYPTSSPDDYYHVESNTIRDIIGIFKSLESANKSIKEHPEFGCAQVTEIILEE